MRVKNYDGEPIDIAPGQAVWLAGTIKEIRLTEQNTTFLVDVDGANSTVNSGALLRVR